MRLQGLYDGFADGFDFRDPQETEGSIDLELARMCHFAYSRVPLWKGVFDAARVKPDQVRSRDALRLLPLANKTTLLERPVEDRLGIPEGSSVKMSTSGTTGGPMPVFYSKDFYCFIYSLSLFRLRRAEDAPYWGRSVLICYDARANDAGYMSGKPPSTRGKSALGPAASLLGWGRSRLSKKMYISTDARGIIYDIARYNPGRILGSPTYLRLVADAVNSGLGREVRPRTMLSFGEPLDEPTRRYIEETFDCAVFNSYGCNETGIIAFECEAKSGLHIVRDSVIVEVLNDGKPAAEGEEGGVYVTSLKNRGMPLFRYDTGDKAIMGDHDCRCGRKGPKLKSIEGRRSDYVTSSTGKPVSPLRIGTIMHDIQGMPKCQLVELRQSEFVLRVFQPGPVDELVSALRNVLGDVDVQISIERPDALRAKFRAVISMRVPTLVARWSQRSIHS